MPDVLLLAMGDVFHQACILLDAADESRQYAAWRVATDCAEMILAERAETEAGRALKLKVAEWEFEGFENLDRIRHKFRR